MWLSTRPALIALLAWVPFASANASVVAGNAFPATAADDTGFLVQVVGNDQIYPEGPPPLFPVSHWQFRYRTGATTIDDLTINGVDLGGIAGVPCPPDYCRSVWSSWSATIGDPASITVAVTFSGQTQVEVVQNTLFNGGFSILEDVADVPEPASVLFMGSTLLGVVAARRYRGAMVAIASTGH